MKRAYENRKILKVGFPKKSGHGAWAFSETEERKTRLLLLHEPGRSQNSDTEQEKNNE